MSPFTCKRLVATIVIFGILAFGCLTTGMAATYTVNYRYDKNGRLTKASYSKIKEISYSYDATGNLTGIYFGFPRNSFPWPVFMPAITKKNPGDKTKFPLSTLEKKKSPLK